MVLNRLPRPRRPRKRSRPLSLRSSAARSESFLASCWASFSRSSSFLRTTLGRSLNEEPAVLDAPRVFVEVEAWGWVWMVELELDDSGSVADVVVVGRGMGVAEDEGGAEVGSGAVGVEVEARVLALAAAALPRPRGRPRPPEGAPRTMLRWCDVTNFTHVLQCTVSISQAFVKVVVQDLIE